ncbi:hypothetical protein JA1_003569 [Spathaspora sp. JA1]|nr:hypothetical protein JA1_003569 [Spathaspora sp. JA1]
MLGITHKFASVQHPKSNGRVERKWTFEKILKTLLVRNPGNWSMKLAEAAQIYNINPTIFNQSPRYLAIGTSPSIDPLRQQLAKEFEEHHTENDADDDDDNGVYSRDLTMIRLYELDAPRESRDDHTALKKRNMAMINTLKVPYGTPAVCMKGRLVYKKRPSKRSKSESDYDGPYQIQEVLRKGAYRLVNMKGQPDKNTIHQDNLKLAHSFENSPIQTLSSFRKSLHDVEQKLLDKMIQENQMELHELSLTDLKQRRKGMMLFS